MKHFRALLPLLFIIPCVSNAQHLNSGTVPALAPSEQWEKEADQINGKISHARLTKMKNVTEAIVNFFHDSCISDDRFNPLWHGEYFSEKASPGPQMKFSAVCNFYEERASLQVVANDISPLLDHIVVNGQDFLTVRPLSALKNDCPYFEYTVNDAAQGGSMTTRTWLVTADKNLLPYVAVTRREYLTEAQKELNAMRNTILAEMKEKMPVRPLAVQEAEKKAALEQLSTMYYGVDLQVHIKMWLKQYKTDEEYQKAKTDKETADLDSTAHFMEQLLHHLPGAELNKPAVVGVPAADFRGFEDGRSGRMLIRANPSFFDGESTGEKPRFFVVSFSYDPASTEASDIDKQITAKFDVQMLKSMLGN